jgi:hypothetical protein
VIPCPFRAFTGLDCPLCGATRATFALLHGDVVTALDHNALYVAALPLVGLLVALWLVRGTVPARVRSAPVLWAVVVLAAAFGVVRNLPFDAFSILGSGAVPT